MHDEIRSKLWNEGPSAGGEGVSYEAALLEQYKLYVELVDRVSQRRAMTNNYFLSINSLVAIVVGGFLANPPDAPTWFLVFPLIIVEGVCVAWFWIVRSYRQLSGGKWKVVRALEERLPASPWWTEWAIALGKETEDKGKDRSSQGVLAGFAKGTYRSLYTPLTRLEQCIPVLFGLTYVGAFIAALIV